MTQHNITRTPGDTKCLNDEPHSWQVWKQRGTKVRFKCTSGCASVTPWEKQEGTYSMEDVDPSEKNVPTTQDQRERDFLDSLTVPELKSGCKNRGITGYSKMTKQELINTIIDWNIDPNHHVD